jgi:hypothetical protein
MLVLQRSGPGFSDGLPLSFLDYFFFSMFIKLVNMRMRTRGETASKAAPKEQATVPISQANELLLDATLESALQ